MRWKQVFKAKSSDDGKESLQSGDSNAQKNAGKASLRSKIHAVTKAMASKNSSQQENSKTEPLVDPNAIATLVGVIQESLHEQQEPCDKRWPRKLQWPSQKYLHTCWVQTCQMLQQPDLKQPPGEVKLEEGLTQVPWPIARASTAEEGYDQPFRNSSLFHFLVQVAPANAGHVACLGPCLLQHPVPVNTLIVHGDLEYCTLLGHRLHVDLAVYFASLRTLASFLKGNTHLRELVFAFTGCPIYVTDKSQQPVMEGFASQVLPAFEQALAENETLKYVSFRICYKPTQRVNVRRMCATSFEANCRQRAAVLAARHPKVEGASPLASDLPADVLKTILDMAFPLPVPPRVDFEFIHQRSSRNGCHFSFNRHGKPHE